MLHAADKPLRDVHGRLLLRVPSKQHRPHEQPQSARASRQPTARAAEEHEEADELAEVGYWREQLSRLGKLARARVFWWRVGVVSPPDEYLEWFSVLMKIYETF